jgi:hypothetical protein
VKRSIACSIVMLLLVACTAPRRRPPPPVQGPTPTTVDGLAAAIAADAERSEHESDPKIRDELATEASRYAEACLAREPQAAACLYGHALALGLEAKAHPTRAGELLKNMLAALASAEAADPNYDQAGPSRVRALVFIRAPGWPLGPGNFEAGLAAARRAVMLRPQYPPNLLALAEALAKTGDANGARETYARARDAAQALPSTADRDGWLREADQALQRK